MIDISFAAAHLALHQADELTRDAERIRAIAERAAECVLPPVREHPRVRFPRLHVHRPGSARTVRPAF